VNESAPRKRGRPRNSGRRSGKPAYTPINSGALALHDELRALSKAGDKRRMVIAFKKWLDFLTDQAYQGGPIGDDFMEYRETVCLVALDNDPAVSERDAICRILTLRAMSPRREARAYAKLLLCVLQTCRENKVPPPAILEALEEDLERNAKGKGRGSDPDIEWLPARDDALYRAYHAGTTAKELCSPEGFRLALESYVPSLGNRPISDREVLNAEPALYKAIRPLKRQHEITRQCLDELNLLAFYLPVLTPPGA